MHIGEGTRVYRNLVPANLIEMALLRKEGVLTETGALRVTTGKYTGRSPNDKFIVDTPAIHKEIDWRINKGFAVDKFDHLYHRMKDYMQNRELFIFEGYAGSDEPYRMRIRCINEFAWQNLFIHQLLIRPITTEVNFSPDFELICLPGFKADPKEDGTCSEAFIILNFEKGIALIGGTHYAGEIKKAVFTTMNYFLPKQGVLSMHCSANIGSKDDTALFFGLSGTGKTTLSADVDRQLIGDDEHGWSDKGIFNIEGGCYAKCIRLCRDTEPQIWDAIRFGSVLENVAIDENRRTVNYNDESVTENTRVAYPVEYITNARTNGVGGHPKTIIFLTADAFGVLPPIAKLNKEQAMYHFLSGYTSKLAGTERGVSEPQATFSSCFGAPFLPLDPMIYATLLGEKLERYRTNVFLINTGWSGGSYGVGQRINLSYTRAMVTAVIEGKLADVPYDLDPLFNLYVPLDCPGVPKALLNPRNTWMDEVAYIEKATALARLFKKNSEKFSSVLPERVLHAGPIV